MDVIGIDPGLDGGIAIISDAGVLIYDMPTVEYSISGGKMRREINIGALTSIIRKVHGTAYVEALNGRPGRGATEFRLGETYGMIKAVCVLTGTPYKLVSPQRWKKHFNLTKDKDTSRAKASAIFPDRAKMFARKKDDGRAEAALIAHYGKSMAQLNQSRKEKSDGN